MNLSGKTALITGSNSGIGYAIAEGLASEGVNIFLHSITDDKSNHQLAVKLSKKFSIKASYLQANLSSSSAARDLVKRTNHIDILINNAGLQHVSPIEKLETTTWDTMIAVMLSAVFHTTAIALPMMKKSGWGRIINISSAHGLVASSQKSAYVSAKHGVIGFTKVTALETAEFPITANSICPGFTQTPLLEKQIPALMKQYEMSREQLVSDILMERQPSKEFVEVNQIAGLVKFLCSRDAEQITGSAISIDGGWTAM
tara:strand:- start:183 stop:956 length:774 start_codon:yes stop_codon:yes gene_type:complete